MLNVSHNFDPAPINTRLGSYQHTGTCAVSLHSLATGYKMLPKRQTLEVIIKARTRYSRTSSLANSQRRCIGKGRIGRACEVLLRQPLEVILGNVAGTKEGKSPYIYFTILLYEPSR